MLTCYSQTVKADQNIGNKRICMSAESPVQIEKSPFRSLSVASMSIENKYRVPYPVLCYPELIRKYGYAVGEELNLKQVAAIVGHCDRSAAFRIYV